MNVGVTRVFYRNAASKSEIVANRGGARSSKSYSLCQLFLVRFLKERQKKILILRKTLPSLRLSTLAVFKELMERWGIGDRIREERAWLNYYYGGNLLHFGSLDDPEKIKSTDWHYIWMEEANEFTYEDFQILKLRLSAPRSDKGRNQLFMSFNPIDQYSWIKEKVVDGPEECEEIVSTYKDNPTLSAEYIRILERLIEQDVNYYNIYALGLWGRLVNLIYSVYQEVNEIPTSGEVIYGLDFGFNNETALARYTIVDKTNVFEEELLYRTGLTNSDLIREMSVLIPESHKRKPIYADSAEPDRIEEIHRAGFNVHPAYKGPNSVKDGIDFVKTLKVYILRSSVNILKEKRAYSWKTDRKGHVLDEPVEFRDHLMACERYALYTHLRKLFTPGIFVIKKGS